MTTRALRSDALPEGLDTEDTGCDLHPRCLSCPLPHCRYDLPAGVATLKRAYRARRAQDLRRRGYPVAGIAQELQLSHRQVIRLCRWPVPPDLLEEPSDE